MLSNWLLRHTKQAKIAHQFVLIVAIGLVSTAIPGALIIYSFTKDRLIENEASALSAETKTLVEIYSAKLTDAEHSLQSLARILSEQLANPPTVKDVASFEALMEFDTDGVWRNRRGSFNGKYQAGVFLPVKSPSASTKSLVVRSAHVLQIFGAGFPPEVRPNVWLSTHDRAEIAFDRTYPDFVFQMPAETDYTQTPWMTLGSYEQNPTRSVRFTSPILDPVSGAWLVSAVYPLDANGQWIGTIGHDLQVKRLLAQFFGGNQRFAGEKHLLISESGKYILGGPWQSELESANKPFEPDLAVERGLRDLLAIRLDEKPRVVALDTSIRGEDYLVVGLRIPKLNWSYYRLVPRNQILAPAQQLLAALVLLVLIVGFSNGIVVNVLVGRRIGRRVHELVNSIRTYGMDPAKYKPIAVEGIDEISTVGRAFNDMAVSRNVQRRLEQTLIRFDRLASSGMERTSLAEEFCNAFLTLGFEAVWVGKIDAYGTLMPCIASGVHESLAISSFREFLRDTAKSVRIPASCETVSAVETLAVPFSVDADTSCYLVFRGSFSEILGADAEKRIEWMTERFEAAFRAGIDQRWLRLQGAALSSSASSIFITDRNGVIQWVNESFERVTGFVRNEVLGLTPRVLKSGIHSIEHYHNLWKTILDGRSWHGKVTNRRKDGNPYIALQTVTPFVDDSGSINHFVAVQEDITEIEEKEAYIKHQATHDVLTGLGNRVMLDETIQAAMQEVDQFGGVLSVMFIDLDQFKFVNDTMGHGVGDKLLVEVSKRLSAALSGSDRLTRFGGDEFIAVVTSADSPEHTDRIASRVLQVFERPFQVASSNLSVNASIGISQYPSHGTTVSLLIQRADAAMYHAKALGRNQYQYFNAEISEQAIHRRVLEEEMRHDLEHGGFTLFYQLQRSIDGSKPIGVEALIRWQRGDRMRQPAEFIGIAEETGMIIQMGEWVLREACRQAREWIDSGKPTRIAVNLSARQFADDKLIDVVRDVLAEFKLPAHLLEIELTESTAMKNPDKAMEVMHRLKELGVRIALDDFGTGYSNLIHLKRLPVDMLKTDRTFIADIETDPDNAALLASVIDLAHILRMKILPEGVETEGQRKLLEEMGADYCQGYLLAKPMSALELERSHFL